MLGYSQARGRLCVSCIGRWILYHWATREALAGTVYIYSFFFFFWLHCTACLILVLQPGIEPLHPGVGQQSPNHGTAREFSQANLGRKGQCECHSMTWRRGCPDICKRQRWKVTGKQILNGIMIVLKVMQRPEPATASMAQKLKGHLS